jgi:hypothetical protein
LVRCAANPAVRAWTSLHLATAPHKSAHSGFCPADLASTYRDNDFVYDLVLGPIQLHQPAPIWRAPH